MRNSLCLFKVLPNELVSNILAMLGYRDLAFCMKVCKRMRDLIGISSLLQYHLELGKSGMEDGPLSTMSISERRERLRAHTDAWRNLQWSDCVHLFDTGTHECNIHLAPGGILVVCRKTKPKLTFIQLPSNTRGITMRQWEHSFPFRPYDSAVTLDPCEDVLVLLKNDRWCLYFFSLRSGVPHPLAAGPIYLKSPPRYRNPSVLKLFVAGKYVVALIPNCQLKVYDWKTGNAIICITSPALRSVVILPESRILLGSTHTRDLAPRLIRDGVADGPVLAMYNLDQVPIPSLKSTRRKPPPAVLFALECAHGAVLTDISLLYRINAHSYSSELAVPFFGSSVDDIVFLQYSSLLNARISRNTLLFPISTLLKHVPTTNDRQPKTRHIQWDDWGAAKTSFSYPAIYHQNLLSGTRFLNPQFAHGCFDIWDLGCARLMQHRTVPFVREKVVLPTEISGWVDVSIAEDVIVIYETSRHNSRLYLLVF